MGAYCNRWETVYNLTSLSPYNVLEWAVTIAIKRTLYGRVLLEGGNMRIIGIVASLVFIVAGPLTAYAQGPTPQPQHTAVSSPCYIELPAIYLVIDKVCHHIADWDTFLNLGYKQSDITPCGEAANDPEGSPITRLLKGSGDEVYWMQDGVRRHIPDMDTFTSLGFQVKNITVLPDEVVNGWPLGNPIGSVIEATPPDTVYQETTISTYTIRLWHHALWGYATISAPQQADVRIDDVEAIGKLPAPDITGDGSPDVMFLTRDGGSHCCWGTEIYELGATPTKILHLDDADEAYGAVGRGKFEDLNGDGIYELVTNDPLPIFCSGQSVQVVLRYDPAVHGYRGASPSFASYYNDVLAQLSATVENRLAPHSFCDVEPLVVTLLYIGRAADAQTTFNKLYTANDAATLWAQLQANIQHGRYYVASN